MLRFKQWVNKVARNPLGLLKFNAHKIPSSQIPGSNHLASLQVSNFPLISRFPGFAYGPLRNICPYFVKVEDNCQRLQIELINENPEILNFNFVAIWVKDEKDNLTRYRGPFRCEMSSTSDVLPDPNAAMHGDERNTVSVHSKRELKPWWSVTFDHEVDIAYVEFCNRKDVFGSRSRGSVISLFGSNGKCVKRYSRVIAKDASAAFVKEGLEALNSAIQYLAQEGYGELSHSIESTFFEWAVSAAMNPTIKSKLLEDLCLADQKIAYDTPDLSGEQKHAKQFEIPKGTRYFRVVAFGQKGKRSIDLNVAVNGHINLMSAYATDNLEHELFELKRNNWMLLGTHIFEQELDSSVVNNVSIWHGGFYSSATFVQRIIQISNDGQSWQTIESTLDNMTARLQLLQCAEWLLGQNWSDKFCDRLGHFMATYRIAHARAVKALFKKQRDLLPIFFDGIDAGAQSAKYIPKVTYARHGLVVPLNEIDSEFLASRMKRFCDFIKQQFNLDAFLCYGTLLGIYRDGDFLPHDDDVDLAVVVDLPKGQNYREASEGWVSEFEKVGVKCRLPTPSSLNMHCYFEDFDMDLFFIYRVPEKSTKVWTHMEGYKTREVNSNLLEPLATHDFKGITFNVPGNVEGFLKDRYGPGWVTPDPTFEL